jgi:dihydrofolate synthase/folylpolyglutamate synthase
MTNYERLVRKLYMTNLFNPVKLGLENMDKLHALLDRPMDNPTIAVVHVAGSNGKGSVSLKTAHTLQKYTGCKVGLFVSPHISSFRERIQINGMPISEQQVEMHLQYIFDICEKENIPATFFEVTTALAFRIFDIENVDVVVLETGLGGRLDATNVICKPALSVITSIGLEHTRILGDTIELIALEKGGIMKTDCPVLVGKNVPLEVLQRQSIEKGVSCLYTCDDVLGSPGVEPSFEDYDIENSRIATAAIQLLQSHRQKHNSHIKSLSNDEITMGVQIRPPCRFEELDIPVIISGTAMTKTVRVILDVAHNPQAMDYLIVKLRANYPTSNVRVVVGMSADKDLRYCTDVILNYVNNNSERVHLVEASHPRAASISSMMKSNPKLVDCHYSTTCDDSFNNNRDNDASSSVSIQVRSALQLAAVNDEIVVVCGTVFIMADAREELGIVEPRDSDAIADVAGAGFRSSQENFDDGDKKKGRSSLN